MKNSLIKLTAIFSFVLLTMPSIQAQGDLLDPGFPIATACAGDDCDGLSSTIVAYAPECDDLGVFYNYQIEVEPHSLCPDTDAIITISSCGNVINAFTISSGSGNFLVPFQISCDCDIQVDIQLVPNGNIIFCKRLGYVTAILSTY